MCLLEQPSSGGKTQDTNYNTIQYNTIQYKVLMQAKLDAKGKC